MARERKTIDVWHVLVDYGQGYEHECTEFHHFAAIEQRRTYRANCPYPVKIKRTREKKSDYTPEQLQAADAERKAARDRWLASLKAKREAVTA